jgi:hypothetical protein
VLSHVLEDPFRKSAVGVPPVSRRTSQLDDQVVFADGTSESSSYSESGSGSHTSTPKETKRTPAFGSSPLEILDIRGLHPRLPHFRFLTVVFVLFFHAQRPRRVHFRPAPPLQP